MTILIFTDQNDVSTNEIIRWIHLLDESSVILRINCLDDFLKAEIPDSNCVFFIRRYRHFLKEAINTNTSNDNIKDELVSHSKMEILTLMNFQIHNCKKVIGNYPKQENKLIQLQLAKEIGLKFPDSIVTKSKQELLHFQNKHEQIIIKPIYNSISLKHENELFVSYTSRIGQSEIEKFPDIIFPAIAQKEIEKKFEIRTFYFYGKCYSMAIFSQDNLQTSVDFRKYSLKKPSQQLPYQLDAKLEEKITQFMRASDYVMGSFDFIVDTKGNVFFLEVNPEGQFGMVSKPCNYFIEKKIAKKILINGIS